MPNRILIAAALLPALCTAAHPAETHPFDVVVYGGTAGGTIAAIAAANEGLDVCIAEPGKYIGGMVTGGLGATDFAKKQVIGGMSREFFERVGKHYGEDITWYFEPHVAQEVFADWIDEAGVEVFFQQRADTVDVSGGRITGVTMDNGTVFQAKVFIDASYEGDLLPRAGITYTWGREGQQVYGESLAGRIAHSPKHQFYVQVDPYGADGSLLPLVYGGDPGEPGEGDKKVQAYNFRLCMTQDKDNMVPFPKPEGYDPARWELLARYLAARPELTVREVMSIRMMPNGKTDTNNNGPISTDYINGSWEYPEADYARRAEIWAEHKRYVQGFCYFLANDPRVPEKLHDEMNTWGLAADEFTDNANWPHQLYIREVRRMTGAYVMTQKDLQTDRRKDDSIGMGSYNSDSHNVQRMPVDNGHWPGGGPGVENEGDMQVPVQPYEISYHCLTPKRDECANLLVASCVSASHVAYSSIRMEPQYMIMGHAAGVAAAQAIASGGPVQDIDIAVLQERLRGQDAVLSLADSTLITFDPEKLDGYVLDNDAAELTGYWDMSTSCPPFVGAIYLHDENVGKGEKRARFVPDLPEAGAYDVRVAYSPNPNRATNVPVTIHTASGEVTREVNQREAPPGKQPFVSLGTFPLGAGGAGWVEIGTHGTNGYVTVDAVQWLAK